MRTLRAAATEGAFSLTVGLARPGTYRFTAPTQAGRKLDAGASAPVTVHVSG